MTSICEPRLLHHLLVQAHEAATGHLPSSSKCALHLILLHEIDIGSLRRVAHVACVLHADPDAVRIGTPTKIPSFDHRKVYTV